MNSEIHIADSAIGPGRPVYVVAEISANHNQSYERAVEMIHAAKQVGADAVKLQTYTPDTLTIDCDNEYFRIGKGSIWQGQKLYDLYSKAYMPWDWQLKLKKVADELGMDLFSTPFDFTAVDFLGEMGVPAYKVASFELVDIPLIEYIASKGKPIIMSTGMATQEEIHEAVEAAYGAEAQQIALLKCTSAYPSPPEEMDLRTIPDMAERFGVPVGLSDHTLNVAVPVAAVAMGACIIEKHFTLSRSDPGPDVAFSLEPNEFTDMVEAVRTVEKALGEVRYQVTAHEAASRVFRRSLFVVGNVKAGERFTERNVRSIRPGYGLPPKELSRVLGRCAACDIDRGTPLTREHIA